MKGTKADFEVGQRVWIINDYGPKRPRQGTVTKVGRTRVTVTEDDARWQAEQQFYIETGSDVSGYHQSRIETEAQRDNRERASAAIQRIDSTRTIEIRYAHRLSAAQLETIADIVEGKS
jgi:hypothetical protein